MQDIVKYMAPRLRIETVQEMYDMGAIDEDRAIYLLQGPGEIDLSGKLVRRKAMEKEKGQE